MFVNVLLMDVLTRPSQRLMKTVSEGGANSIMSEWDSYVPLPRPCPREKSRTAYVDESEDDSEEERRKKRGRLRCMRREEQYPLLIEEDDSLISDLDEKDFPLDEPDHSPAPRSTRASSPRTARTYDSSDQQVTPDGCRIIDDDSVVRELAAHFNEHLSNEWMANGETEAKIRIVLENFKKTEAIIEASKREYRLNNRERKASESERYVAYREFQKQRKREVIVEQPVPRDPAASALAKAKADWEKATRGSYGGKKG